MYELLKMKQRLDEVTDTDVREYLQEALACYSVRAFRACIVMTANAVFDHLIARVEDFAQYDKAAEDLRGRIDGDLKSQRSFEAHMIEELHKSKFVTDAQKFELSNIREGRNKAAHPSGIHATEEDAQKIFMTSVDVFLKPRWLTAEEGSRRLIAEMKAGSIFPNSGDDLAVVDEKLLQIHALAHPKLIGDLWSELKSPTDDAFRSNALRFLVALASKHDEGHRGSIGKKLGSSKKKISGTSWEDHLWLAMVINADIALLRTLEGSQRRLMDEQLAATFSEAECVRDRLLAVSEGFIEAIAISPDRKLLVANFPDAIRAAIEVSGVRAVLFGSLKQADLMRDCALAPVWDSWEDGHSALRVAKALPDVDGVLAGHLSGQEGFDLIAALCAFSRQMKQSPVSQLVDTGFGLAPALREKAIAFMNEQPDQAIETLEHFDLCGPAMLLSDYLTPRRRVFHKRVAG